MSKKEYNPVNEMKLWKDRIESEYSVAAEWETNWGFLKAKKAGQGQHGNNDDGLSSVLTGASPAEAACTVPEDPQNLSPKTKQDLGDNSVVLTSKLRYTVNRGKTPKEKQSRPHTTSQEVGWRPSVELFGVAHYGIKRDDGIWPQ